MIPAQGVGSLSTLIKRLEAATSRLEDIALTQTPAPRAGAAVASSAPVPAAVAAPAPDVVVVRPSVGAFQDVIDGALANYLKLSEGLGGLVAEQAAHVSSAFEAQKSFIQLASECTKLSTSSPTYPALLGPTQTALVAAVDVKEKNRPSKQINQLSTVSEGIPALGWVTLDNKPGPFIGDMKESAQFYANRVVKDNKESDPKQVEWARSFIALLEDLRKYVMQYHTTGLSWNPKGVDATTYQSTSAPPAAPAPPPPPPPAPAAPHAPAAAAAGDMGGVFAALNKGEGVTSGLKKVDKSEMTHKNPELRAGGIVSAKTSPVLKGGPLKPPKPQSFVKKPAKTELEGNKWNIENHENNREILIAETEINQIVNVFNVKNCVIQIKGKVNAISLVNCTKTSLLIDSTVSSLAISTSASFIVQILGKVPTILIDGTDCGQIYLSKDSLDVEIVTAKSSSINVSLPVEGEEEGIFVERAVPEQMKTVVKGGKLVTTIVEHSG